MDVLKAELAFGLPKNVQKVLIEARRMQDGSGAWFHNALATCQKIFPDAEAQGGCAGGGAHPIWSANGNPESFDT